MNVPFNFTTYTPLTAPVKLVAASQRSMAKVKLTPAQKSAKEKAQHAKLVEEVMNKLDEPDFAYVNQGQREAIKNHTNLVIVLHMVLDDVKEFKKRLDTWCSWNPGTPGVFAPKKTEEEKKAERDAAAAAAAAAEAEANATASTTTTAARPSSTVKETAAPKVAPKKPAPREAEEEDADDAIVPDDVEAEVSSGPFELKSFLKQCGLTGKSVESVQKKLSDAGFKQSTLSEVNDAYLKKLGIPQPERQQVLKGAFDWLSKHPSSD
jgi:hypothetical protein